MPKVDSDAIGEIPGHLSFNSSTAVPFKVSSFRKELNCVKKYHTTTNIVESNYVRGGSRAARGAPQCALGCSLFDVEV